MTKRREINRRVSSRRQVKRWPQAANQNRIDSIGYAMDAREQIKKAEKQIEPLRQAIIDRDTTLALLELTRLKLALVEMKLPIEQIINLLDNAPPNIIEDDDGDD